jgi:hypothetical protein
MDKKISELANSASLRMKILRGAEVRTLYADEWSVNGRARQAENFSGVASREIMHSTRQGAAVLRPCKEKK